MDPGEQITGTRDEHYNLIAVLYHALHGAENCEMYAADAEVVGREEMAAFFLEAQAEQIELAERAKELLGIGGVVPGAPAERAPVDTVPGDIPPEDVTTPLDTAPPTDVVSPPETWRTGAPAGGATVEPDVPPDSTPVDVRGRAAPEVGFPSETPTGVPPETPGDVPPEPSMPQDLPPRTEDVSRMEGAATVERDVPPETTPEGLPPRSADVQREDQVPADQVSAPMERPIGDVPPRADDLRTEAIVPPDVGVAPPERVEASPDAPRAEEASPRIADVPPGDEPPEDEGDTAASSRQYFGDMIREGDRRSRGEI
jgi:hypothetical protein